MTNYKTELKPCPYCDGVLRRTYGIRASIEECTECDKYLKVEHNVCEPDLNAGQPLYKHTPIKEKIKFRPICGELHTEMSKVIEIDSKDELFNFIKHEIWQKGGVHPLLITLDNLHIKPYGYDERIGWNTHIVTLDNFGVIGYTNGNLE